MWNHFAKLGNGTHPNRKLLKDFEKYGGKSAFSVTLLCTANTQEQAYKFENIFMKGYESEYNILPKAGTMKGRKYTPETIRKMSEAAKGREFSKEQIEKFRLAQLGVKQTDEVKEKRKQSLLEFYKHNDRKGLKISSELAYTIMLLVDKGFDRAFVSEYYNIPRTTVTSIANGTTRKRIYKKFQEDKKLGKV